MTIFVVHIEQVDRVTDRVSIEHTFLDEHRWKASGVCVDDGRSNAAARTFTSDNN